MASECEDNPPSLTLVAVPRLADFCWRLLATASKTKSDLLSSVDGLHKTIANLEVEGGLASDFRYRSSFKNYWHDTFRYSKKLRLCQNHVKIELLGSARREDRTPAVRLAHNCGISTPL